MSYHIMSSYTTALSQVLRLLISINPEIDEVVEKIIEIAVDATNF
jgi:hypothetical protein